MRIFVITDLHGKNELFRKSLKEIGLKKTDKLILLGDIIDRGEDSKGLLDTIILLKEHSFDVTCLMGNHEQMLLDAHLNVNNLNLWLLNGGDKTLSSFLTSSSRKSIVSGKLCPVSMCNKGKGTFPGKKAFLARCVNTMESLPPEKRITGF